jgi:hypothetical protein
MTSVGSLWDRMYWDWDKGDRAFFSRLIGERSKSTVSFSLFVPDIPTPPTQTSQTPPRFPFSL